ncbi:hypothetical protein TNCV_2206491 [Trichonephila clavipes]|uniref:Uncharacterized protein n=1 Tax=Trichonephila clavipes TaxID=2585209 RepID=A0A8X6S5L4_TRICX|nr:hypothetical protein TNCV_2206491 [Trichonephila clavipes]
MSIPPSRLSERHFADSLPPAEEKTNRTRQRIICCSKRDSKGKKDNFLRTVGKLKADKSYAEDARGLQVT